MQKTHFGELCFPPRMKLQPKNSCRATAKRHLRPDAGAEGQERGVKRKVAQLLGARARQPCRRCTRAPGPHRRGSSPASARGARQHEASFAGYGAHLEAEKGTKHSEQSWAHAAVCCVAMGARRVLQTRICPPGNLEVAARARLAVRCLRPAKPACRMWCRASDR